MSGRLPYPEGSTPGGKGRFEGYEVLGQRRYWDEQTRELVMGRLDNIPQLEFFSPAEAETAGALLDTILDQHEDPRVPVLAMVDARLHAGETDGWRYEDMPEDAMAWRESLLFLDDDAIQSFGHRFHECSLEDQGRVVQGVQDTEGAWYSLPAKHVWSLWSRYACSAFYSHPLAWNEIGFGGPAYPRGYKVLHPGWREPWEVAEHQAADPVPWATQVERAKRSHEVRTDTKADQE